MQSRALSLVALLSLACSPDQGSGDTPCSPGTVRSGAECLPVGGAAGDASLGGDKPAPGGEAPSPGGAEPAPGGEAPAPGGETPAPGGETPAPVLALPLAVDDFFAPSGYMGDGERPGGIVAAECTPPVAAVGRCHSFTWTPGEVGWAGVWWQNPEGNWGGESGAPGLAMPAGAAQVSFLAWGERGDEVVSFNAGLSPEVDGFTRGVAEVTLTGNATRYRIDLRGVTYDRVVGGFSWVAGGAAAPVTLHIADIVWSQSTEGLPELPPAAGEPLPVVVDDHWAPSGYMGDGATPGGIEVGECPERGSADAVGLCRAYTWNPGREGWAGIYWQYPENNWGMAPGLQVAQGATEVSFWAWGALGGEVVTFGAGIPDVDGFGVERPQVVLEAVPTRYTIDLTAVTYDEVVGAFKWVTADAAAPVTFFIDDLTWR